MRLFLHQVLLALVAYILSAWISSGQWPVSALYVVACPTRSLDSFVGIPARGVGGHVALEGREAELGPELHRPALLAPDDNLGLTDPSWVILLSTP